ncbi:MAG: hypothetical protein JWN66_859 [Sphingomonas bacterium]|uniref:hypothetical protein n=1 Tax=Sphingomonas bacterium TaxID=1895847 RepID=UPI0026311844|nr:hypothetical protein [Sphingomonas bacterium]MDB5703743.1 hypothetical protein [Sphingomonas bacterium]
MAGLLLISLVLMASNGADGQASPATPDSHAESGRSRLFISPMGEPFRSDHDPQDLWFDQADINHDGALSLDEFSKDAARFFAMLDREHDGEIDPQDIDYYESNLVPEIRVDANEGQSYAEVEGGDSDGEGGSTTHSQHARLGAARFGYFDFPEPVMVADTNFDRGVDANEFQRAAEKRFALLDTNGDGRIQRAELPRLSAVSVGRRAKKEKHRR